jgi:hypothetical protein
MMRTWKMLGVKTVLAALLVTTFGLAGTKTEGPPDDSKKLDEIQKQLDEIKKTLAEVNKKLAALDKVEQKLSDLQTGPDLAVQNALRSVGDMKQQMDRLQEEVKGLRGRLPATQSRMAFAAPPQPAAGNGYVEMVNTYPGEVSVLVNNRAYRVPPGQVVLSDPVPAGTFTYEVRGITVPVSRTLAANKTFTIHIHPQQ